MMTAALTEVLNVWPILAKRIGVEDKIIYFTDGTCVWKNYWLLISLDLF